MKQEFDPEYESENKIARICGAVFEAILGSLTEKQDAVARDILRRVVANPKVYADDKRVLAIIAGSTEEELDQLMTNLYGRRPSFRVIDGGGSAA